MSERIICGCFAFRSSSTIVQQGQLLRHAHLPGEELAIPFGMHKEVGDWYGLPADSYESHATPLDYLVAAVGGCLTGTFGAALEGAGIPSGDGRLRTTVEGEVDDEGGPTPLLKRIRVRYTLAVDDGVDRTLIDAALASHAAVCPTAASIAPAVDITTEVEVVAA